MPEAQLLLFTWFACKPVFVEEFHMHYSLQDNVGISSAEHSKQERGEKAQAVD